MPFLSPKRKVSDAENKLRVLFCVKTLGMATLEQLWPFVAALELMEYVPLCVFVDELKKDGALGVGSHAIEGALYLTEEGTEMLRLFGDRLLTGDCERIQKTAPAYAARMSERRQVRAVHERSVNNAYRVACTVREGDVPTLFLRVITQSRAFAALAIKRFSRCAPRLLMQLYTLPVTNDVHAPSPFYETVETLEAALSACEPERAVICAHGKHEHSAVVHLRGERADFIVALLLPDRMAALDWTRAALMAEDDLSKKITAAFLPE